MVAMGKALYRKYRSQSLDEIVGQEHITTTLKNALKQGRISHAYLFTGPRGVGKTSIARILAFEVNNLPYDEQGTHLDIIEIDAASNRRIDEIRDLRDKVHIAPTSAQYKVYIIDEVHMLTKEAFNALLKTLEEPPEHVIFILATTEAHKLPETIISRTQRFSFKPVPNSKVVAHLREIATKEKIDISDEALLLIAQHGEGSFRDSISLLDQVRGAHQNIDETVVRQAIGVPPNEHIERICTAIASQNATEAMQELQAMYDAGYQPSQIAQSIGAYVRQDILASSQTNATSLNLVRQLLEVPASSYPGAYLELAVLEASTSVLPVPTKPVTPIAPTTQQSSPEPKTSAPKVETEQSPPVKSTVKPKPNPAKAAGPDQATSTPLQPDYWQAVLDAMKGKHNTLYGIARMAQPRFEDDALVLSFAFPFHQRRCNEPRNKQHIQDIVHQTTGKNVKVTCVVDERSKPPKDTSTTPKPAKSDTLQSITSVFGGGEVLED